MQGKVSVVIIQMFRSSYSVDGADDDDDDGVGGGRAVLAVAVAMVIVL